MAANPLSNMLGSVSIACWIVVYSPQYIENYQRQSAEAISVTFVAIWLLGDIANLVGASLAHLLPTVIILALYYTLCDLALLFQIYYYRWKTSSRRQPLEVDSEDSPLISRPDRSKPDVPGNPSPNTFSSIQHFVSIAFVLATGAVAWLISDEKNSGGQLPGPDFPPPLKWTIQILGWSSASLYFGARIPQIRKNIKTRCEGLAPALFLWAISGNATYALSICVAAPSLTDHTYWVTNASWLAGSALVMFLDVIILGQMAYYRRRGEMNERAANAAREVESLSTESGSGS